MNKEFIIKKTPLQKIVLRKNEFEIINQQYKKENGVFAYSKTNSILFKHKGTDYKSSIFFSILNFILPGQGDFIFKTKERITINYKGNEKSFILFDFDKEAVLEAISEINKRIK